MSTTQTKQALPVSLLFAAICEWALKQGAVSIKALPGCWEGRCGDYEVSINGHGETKANAAGLTVPSYSAMLMRDGWPAAIIDPAGGTVCNGATEDELIALFEAAL